MTKIKNFKNVSLKSKIFLGAIVLICLSLLLYLHLLPPPHFRAVFLDVGQGDASLIFLQNGAKILVDCGQNQKILRKLGEQLPFFDRQIDYLMVTHPDLDHYGGCIDVLQRYEVKTIFINGAVKEKDQTFMSWQEYQNTEGADIYVIKGPSEYVLDGAKLKFYNPDSDFIDAKTGDNDKSLVFKFSYNSTTIFFAADMENSLEKRMLDKYCFTSSSYCPEFKSDYLKIGHHGSDSSSNQDFLMAVDPDTAVISVGKNKYGHPSSRVLKRLERLNIDFLRTDQKGDIIVK